MRGLSLAARRAAIAAIVSADKKGVSPKQTIATPSNPASASRAWSARARSELFGLERDRDVNRPPPPRSARCPCRRRRCAGCTGAVNAVDQMEQHRANRRWMQHFMQIGLHPGALPAQE